MARKCSVCSHKDHNKIDFELTARIDSIDTISKRYKLTISSLNRHIASGHLPQKVAKAVQAKEVAQADTLLDQVKGLSARALSILSQAEGKQDLRTACSAIREVRATLELLLKVSGELKGDQTTVNVAVVTHEYRLVKGVDPPARE